MAKKHDFRGFLAPHATIPQNVSNCSPEQEIWCAGDPPSSEGREVRNEDRKKKTWPSNLVPPCFGQNGQNGQKGSPKSQKSWKSLKIAKNRPNLPFLTSGWCQMDMATSYGLFWQKKFRPPVLVPKNAIFGLFSLEMTKNGQKTAKMT